MPQGKGTESLQAPAAVVPGAQIFPKGQTPAAAALRAFIEWPIAYIGTARSDAGAPVAALDLSTVNAAIQTFALSFPGGADDNSWFIPVKLPANYDRVQTASVTLTLIDAAGSSANQGMFQVSVMRNRSGGNLSAGVFGNAALLLLNAPTQNVVYAVSATLDMQNAQAGDLLHLMVRRDGANARDTLADDVTVITVSLDFGTT